MPTLKEQLKILQAKKQYEAMIALLEASDEPNRNVIIARIKLRMKDEAKAQADLKSACAPVTKKPLPGTEGAPAKAKGSNMANRLSMILIVSSTAIIVGFGIFVAVSQRNSGMYAAVYGVCSEVFRDEYYDEMFTAHQFVQGCLVVADETIDRYGQEVTYCYDNENQTDARFLECLADNEVKMYSTAILNTPKE